MRIPFPWQLVSGSPEEHTQERGQALLWPAAPEASPPVQCHPALNSSGVLDFVVDEVHLNISAHKHLISVLAHDETGVVHRHR